MAGAPSGFAPSIYRLLLRTADQLGRASRRRELFPLDEAEKLPAPCALVDFNGADEAALRRAAGAPSVVRRFVQLQARYSLARIAQRRAVAQRDDDDGDDDGGDDDDDDDDDGDDDDSSACVDHDRHSRRRGRRRRGRRALTRSSSSSSSSSSNSSTRSSSSAAVDDDEARLADDAVTLLRAMNERIAHLLSDDYMPRPAFVKHRIGDVFEHKRWKYRAVIVGWDPTCRASDAWKRAMGIHMLDEQEWQPFYTALPDLRQRAPSTSAAMLTADAWQTSTYVAQENIVPLSGAHATATAATPPTAATVLGARERPPQRLQRLRSLQQQRRTDDHGNNLSHNDDDDDDDDKNNNNNNNNKNNNNNGEDGDDDDNNNNELLVTALGDVLDDDDDVDVDDDDDGVMHPLVAELFDSYDPVTKRYRPKEALRKAFPEY